MYCDACGLTFDDEHNCPGAGYVHEGEAAPSAGFAPLYYFQQALKIVSWDDAAIRRTARDRNSLQYGIIFWVIGMLITFAVSLIAAIGAGMPINPATMIIGMVVLLIISAVYDATRYGLCHLIAKYLFGGTGKFITILRPISLGSILIWLAWIPVVGLIAAGIGTIAIVMLTFEEIEGIERMQAFGISVVVNIGFAYLAYAFGLFHR
jgi:hypothetical protein